VNVDQLFENVIGQHISKLGNISSIWQHQMTTLAKSVKQFRSKRVTVFPPQFLQRRFVVLFLAISFLSPLVLAILFCRPSVFDSDFQTATFKQRLSNSDFQTATLFILKLTSEKKREEGLRDLRFETRTGQLFFFF